MPQISKLIPTDFQIKSHTFRPPNPALSVMYGGTDNMPNSCNLCHVKESPEWAIRVLGQQIPQVTATPVPPPTPFPITTSAVSFSSLSMMSEEESLETGFKIDAINLFWIVLISVLSISVVVWIRRGG